MGKRAAIIGIFVGSVISCFGQVELSLAGFRSLAATCATADTTLATNQLREGFQGTGYESANWAEPATTVDEDASTASLSTGKPVGACNEAAYCTASETNCYIRWDRGSAIDLTTTEVDIVFYLWISAGPATGNVYTIGNAGAAASGNTGQNPFSLELSESAGTVRIRARGTGNSSYVDITSSVNTSWIKVAVHLDLTTTLSSLTINDGTAQNFERNTANPRYFFFGLTSGLATGESGSLYVDLVCINTP